MDREKEIERLLRENGAEPIRHGNHKVWKLRSGAKFTMPRTGSERLVGGGMAETPLGGEGAARIEAIAGALEGLEAAGGAEDELGGSQGVGEALEGSQGDSPAGESRPIPPRPASRAQVQAQGAWAATIAQTEAWLESLQLSAGEQLARGGAEKRKRYRSPKGLARRVLMEVLLTECGATGRVLPGVSIVREFKRRGHITTKDSLRALCYREARVHGGAGRFEWVRDGHGVKLVG